MAEGERDPRDAMATQARPSMIGSGRLASSVAFIVLVTLASTVAAARHKEAVQYNPENDDDWELPCSREKSRMVRRGLSEFVQPHLDRAGVNFTSACPLSATRDLYYEHESHKQKYRASYWKCLYSNKIFKSEFHLDKHFENRYMDRIPSTADTCVADYCKVFLCDEYAYTFYDALGIPRSRMRGRFVHTPCSESVMAAAQGECRELLESCFRGLGPKGLREFFDESVCQKLTCGSFHTMLSGLNKQRPGRYRVLYVTFAVLVALALLSYYLVVLLSWFERRTRPDLVRRRRAKSRKQL